MHLLALLIAAVFSSQFSKLSNSATFTVLPATAATNAKLKVTVEETAADSWTAPVKLYFTTDATDEPAPDDPAMYATALDTQVSNTPSTYTTTNRVDFSAIAGLAKDDKIYVFVQTNVASTPTVLQVPAEITATGPWGFSSDDVDEDAFTIKNIEVTKPDPDWDVDEADDKVKVYIASEEVDPDDLDAYQDWIGEQVSTAYDDTNDIYKITSIDIHEHTFAKNQKIYVYLQYTADADGDLTWAEGFQTITVAEAAARFAIKAPSPATVYMDATEIAPLTITQTDAEEAAWDKANVKLRLSTDPAEDPETLDDVEINTSTNKDHTVTTCDISGLTLAPGGKIYVYVELTVGGNARILTKPAEISVERSEHPPTFDVTPTKIILAGATTIDIVVTQNDGPETNAAAWTPDVGLFLTKDIAVTPEAGDDWLTATPAGAGYKVAGVVVDDLDLEGGDNLYVWVQHGMTGGANTAVILDVPAVIPVQQNPDTIFTVTPADFDLTDQTSDIVVTQTDQTTAPWPASITVYLTLDDAKEPADIPVKRTLTRTGSASNWVYTIERFNFRELTAIATGNTVYVLVSYEEGEPATTVVVGQKRTIAITGALPAIPFTVVAPEAILEAEKEEPVTFEILPHATQTWTDKTVKLTISASKAAPTGPTPAFTQTITKPEGSDNWEGSIDLSTLVVPDGQTKVYAHVKVNSDPYLPDFAEITYTHGTSEEETNFTLATTQVTWAAGLKTTKNKISPVPATGHRWPEEEESMMVKFVLPAAESNEEKSLELVVEIVEGETEGTAEYFIPAGGDLTTLVAEAPAADVVLEVYVSLDAEGETYLKHKVDFTIKKPGGGGGDAAMGVSPLLSLLAALVFLFVKLF